MPVTPITPAQTDALAKLAEIPAEGSGEGAAWIERARKIGFREAFGGVLYTAQPQHILTLMSEARKQGQRDVLGADLPVQWGDPKTIAGLIAQLRTLPPDAPIYGTFHGPDFPGGGRHSTGVRGVTLSREYVKGRWLSRDPDAELQHVIWTKPAQPEHAADLSATPQASPLRLLSDQDTSEGRDALSSSDPEKQP